MDLSAPNRNAGVFEALAQVVTGFLNVECSHIKRHEDEQCDLTQITA